jgi:hypothetical protein
VRSESIYHPGVVECLHTLPDEVYHMLVGPYRERGRGVLRAALQASHGQLGLQRVDRRRDGSAQRLHAGFNFLWLAADCVEAGTVRNHNREQHQCLQFQTHIADVASHGMFVPKKIHDVLDVRMSICDLLSGVVPS